MNALLSIETTNNYSIFYAFTYVLVKASSFIKIWVTLTYQLKYYYVRGSVTEIRFLM